MLPRRYRITILPAAHRDLVILDEFISRDSPANAAALIDRLLDHIDSLRAMPNRFPIYLESGEFPHDVRCMSVQPCRVLYSVVGKRVIVLRVRHAKQQDLTAQDL